MDDPVAVIFAGGQGTRLWPLSRTATPKQFQPLSDGSTLLGATIDRLLKRVAADRILVSTTEEFASAAAACLGPVPAGNLVVEASGKGPATALALSLARVDHAFGDVPLFICPSDHLFVDEDAFASAVGDMLEQVARTPEAVVMLGAEPTYPDPDLGYFRTRPYADDTVAGVVEVVEQIEKPDRAVAADLLAEGAVFWNTMCYAVCARTALEAYRRRRPDVTEAAEAWVAAADGAPYDGPAARGLELEPFFEDGLPRLLVSRDLGWNDVGTWARVEAYLSASGTSRSVAHESSDVVVASMDGRPVVVLGVKDIIVVTHEDAVYVLDKQRADDVVALGELRAKLGATREDLL